MNDQWQEKAESLGRKFWERAAKHDDAARFVAENYVELKVAGFFKLAIPVQLGGGGASFEETCNALHTLGKYCPSTALALSMHTHLVAANVWKWVNGKPDAEPMLRKVVENDLVLVSTGATDWLDSNGRAQKVDGGYRISAQKRFASGSVGADVLVTSVAAPDEPDGPSVLHFALPIRTQGVRLLEDWNTLGMRGTGSHTVVLEDVYLSDSAVALRRPAGQWHPVWGVVLGVAPPIYMAPYMGVADRMAELALERAQQRTASSSASLVGLLENARTSAHLAWRDMLRLAANYDFLPSLEHSSAQLVRKTLLANAVKRIAELSMELAGGDAFYRTNPIERYFRDAQAVVFHPLPERRQVEFTGRAFLGRDVAGV